MNKKYQLALYTFGIFKKPSDATANDGFHLRNDPILELVDRSPGMIARSGYEGDPGPASWGKQVYPRFYVEQGDGYSPSTLSVWGKVTLSGRNLTYPTVQIPGASSLRGRSAVNCADEIADLVCVGGISDWVDHLRRVLNHADKER